MRSLPTALYMFYKLSNFVISSLQSYLFVHCDTFCYEYALILSVSVPPLNFCCSHFCPLLKFVLLLL